MPSSLRDPYATRAHSVPTFSNSVDGIGIPILLEPSHCAGFTARDSFIVRPQVHAILHIRYRLY